MKQQLFIDPKGNLISCNANSPVFSIVCKASDLRNKTAPVICNHCGKVYCLTEAKVNHRFGDCDQFTTPCCQYKHADTRTYKSFPDFKRIELDKINVCQ